MEIDTKKEYPRHLSEKIEKLLLKIEAQKTKINETLQVNLIRQQVAKKIITFLKGHFDFDCEDVKLFSSRQSLEEKKYLMKENLFLQTFLEFELPTPPSTTRRHVLMNYLRALENLEKIYFIDSKRYAITINEELEYISRTLYNLKGISKEELFEVLHSEFQAAVNLKQHEYWEVFQLYDFKMKKPI